VNQQEVVVMSGFTTAHTRGNLTVSESVQELMQKRRTNPIEPDESLFDRMREVLGARGKTNRKTAGKVLITEPTSIDSGQ